MRYLTTSVIVVVCMAFASGARTAHAQSVGSTLPIFVDYADPPSSIEQLTAMADAVVVVRIEAVSFESPVDPQSGRERTVTKYSVSVLDTLKASSAHPTGQGALTLTRIGGQRLENGKIVVSAEQNFEAFQQLAEYVLFLAWNDRTGECAIHFGPNGSYQLLSTGIVRPLGRSAMAGAQQGKRRESFLQEVRSAAAR